MNYLLDNYEWPFVYIAGLIVLAALSMAFCYLAYRTTKRLKSSPKWVPFSQALAAVGAAISFFLFLGYGPDYLNDGQIEHLYLVEKNNHKRLAVWFTRKDTPGGMTWVYSHRIKSFDLDTGRQRGRLTLSCRYWPNDYRIFGPFHHFAWGYTRQNGMVYLDLFEADAVADEKDILKRNPELGGEVHLVTGKGARRFDPVTFGLYVQSADGRIYQLGEDLSAERVTDLPVEVNLKPEWAYAKHWKFYPLKTSKGKHAHIRGARCNQEKSVTLPEPRYLPESNASVTQKERTWVRHQSALLGEYDWLLSYLEGDGTALNTINVSQLIRGEPLTIISTHTPDSVILIFISAGGTSRSDILGFSLAAVLTDARTGEYLRTISYF